MNQDKRTLLNDILTRLEEPPAPLPSKKPRGELSTAWIVALVSLAGLCVLALETVPAIASWNYPLYLLFVVIHEMGHGVAALLTGGSFSHFIIFPGIGGLSYSGSGWMAVVLLAGSFSVAIFTTLLILLGRDPRLSRITVGVIGVGMAWLSIRYGVPTLFKSGFLDGLFTVAVSLLFGGVFIFVAYRAPLPFITFFQHLLALKGMVVMFADTWGIVRITVPFFGGEIGGDVTMLAEITHIPVFIWGLIWTAAAALMFGAAIWATWFWKVEPRS